MQIQLLFSWQIWLPSLLWHMYVNPHSDFTYAGLDLTKKGGPSCEPGTATTILIPSRSANSNPQCGSRSAPCTAASSAVVLLIFAPCCAIRLSTPRGAGLRWWSADLNDPAASAALDEDSQEARSEETVWIDGVNRGCERGRHRGGNAASPLLAPIRQARYATDAERRDAKFSFFGAPSLPSWVRQHEMEYRRGTMVQV